MRVARSRRALIVAAAILVHGVAMAQSAPLSNSAGKPGADAKGGIGAEPINSFPKFTIGTLANFELAGMSAANGPSRPPRPSLRFDSTALLNLSDELSIDGLFQFKPREPLRADDPNKDLFINQGARRREGGKMKELYVRYGDYRVGKFVQNFGRAYVLLPGAYAADFVEETEQGYEPAEMVGVEKIHVFEDEGSGWRQLSVSAFFVDHTVLHRSFPYDEGVIHLKDGGLGNTRYPENVMVTYDVLNMPVSHWAQMSWQASAIRFGKSAGAQRGELWTTLNGDLAIPIKSSVASTLAREYTQLRLYAEGVRRDNFQGFAGRTRDFLSASAEMLSGSWVLDATTTQRWTTDRVNPLQRDKLYTLAVGYKFPSQTILSFNVAHEEVDHRRGVYAGIRLTQTFTTCSRCLVKGQAY